MFKEKRWWLTWIIVELSSEDSLPQIPIMGISAAVYVLITSHLLLFHTSMKLLVSKKFIIFDSVRSEIRVQRSSRGKKKKQTFRSS